MTTHSSPGSCLVDANQAPASETIENPVHANLARLAAEFANASDDLSCPAEETLISTINSIVHPQTAAEACLAPTLALFGWAGEGRLIQEALPHFDRIDNVEALRRVLSLLGYGTTRKFLKLSKIKSHSIPCLFTRDGTDVTLIVDREPNGTLLAFDGKSASWLRNIVRQKPQVLEVNQVDLFDAEATDATAVHAATTASGPGTAAIVVIVVIIALPIFVICVYDLGIGTKSINTVIMLAIGAGIVIATNMALRSVRARAMAYFGSRIDALISMKAFEVILNMPVSMVEAAPVGTQISRLKQFESMREFFTGTLASSIVDIPFMFIFLIAIALWGGNLVWVPVSLIASKSWS